MIIHISWLVSCLGGAGGIVLIVNSYKRDQSIVDGTNP